jgi:8-amino-7-oxononanoate synthase
VPVIVRETQLVMQTAAKLEERGFFVAAIRPPSVPGESSRLRLTVCAAHTEDDIERLLEALREVLRPAM